MNRHENNRKEDTAIIEIKRLLECLLANKYEFEGTTEVNKGMYSSPNDAIANFKKSISFSDTAGNWINDNSIEVSIQFGKRADYTHFEKNKDEDNEYVGDTHEFIEGLIEETQKKLSKKRQTRKSRSSTNTKRAISI